MRAGLRRVSHVCDARQKTVRFPGRAKAWVASAGRRTKMADGSPRRWSCWMPVGEVQERVCFRRACDVERWARALVMGDEAVIICGWRTWGSRPATFDGAQGRIAAAAFRDSRRCHSRRRGSRAETIGGALVKAYFNNPDINSSAPRCAQRRKRSQGVRRLSAERTPRQTLAFPGGGEQSEPSCGGGQRRVTYNSLPRGYGVSVNETLSTACKPQRVRQAKSQVIGGA